MEKICCASCANRGKGFENTDESGIIHCSKLDRVLEDLCIARNYQAWKPESPQAK